MLADADRRQVLARRIRLLVAATITYNVIEAAVALTEAPARPRPRSSASAWTRSSRSPRQRRSPGSSPRAILRRERKPPCGSSPFFLFFGLALYVTVESLRSLLGYGEPPRHSIVGITLAAVSLIVMPVLSWAQRRTGRELGSRSAVADSKQTLLCTYLSAVLLAGLLLNTLFGWYWADPIAALVIAGVAVREGREAWRGRNCCAPIIPTETDDDGCDCCDSPQPGHR